MNGEIKENATNIINDMKKNALVGYLSVLKCLVENTMHI